VRCRLAGGWSRWRRTRTTPRSRGRTSRAAGSPTSSTCASVPRSTRSPTYRRGPVRPLFIDADKRSNPDYLRRALDLSRPRTLIVADNVVRGGAVADPHSDDPSVIGVRRFLDLVAAEPRLAATAIQTVGSKGHDGFALALVIG
jgi:O-methyltransferase